jgi:hypothetical protein
MMQKSASGILKAGLFADDRRGAVLNTAFEPVSGF